MADTATTKKVTTQTPTSARTAPLKRTSAITTKQTKTQIIQSIAEETGLTKKEVTSVFASLGGLLARHMKKRGSGEMTIPATGVKVRRVRKPARKARMGRNPATGEEIRIPAKPAHTVVKVTPMKGLKDMLSA